MKSYLLIVTLIVLSLMTSACNRAQSSFDGQSKPQPKAHVVAPPHSSVVNAVPLDNGSYAYSQRDDTTNQMIWYYIWFTALNSNNNVSNTNHYYSGNYGSIDRVMTSTKSPTQMGRTVETKEPPVEVVEKDNKVEAGEAVVPVGETAAEEKVVDEKVAEENTEIDHENQTAIENFENEGGAVAPAVEEEPAQQAPESAPAESAPSSESSSSSSESSSSSDSGGGGDGGGGGGGD